MKLVLHLARTELWRLRWWPLGWLVLQVPGLVMLGTEGGLSQGEIHPWLLSTGGATGWLCLVWALALTVGLWSDVDPTRSDRFWLTRPISAGQLAFSSVFVLVVLLLLVPVAFSLPFWIVWDASWPDILAALAEFAHKHGLGALAALVTGLILPRAASDAQRSILAGLLVFTLALVYSFADGVLHRLSLRHGVWIDSSQGITWLPFVAVIVLVSTWTAISRRVRLGSLVLLVSGVAIPVLATFLLRPPVPSECNAEVVRQVIGEPFVLRNLPIGPQGCEPGLSASLPDAPRAEALSAYAIWGFVEQDGRVMPCIPALHTPVTSMDPSEEEWRAALHDPRLMGALLDTSFLACWSAAKSSRPAHPAVDLFRPLRVCAVLALEAERREFVLDQEIDVQTFAPPMRSLNGEWSLFLRRIGPELEFRAVGPFLLQGCTRNPSPKAMLRLIGPDGALLKGMRSGDRSYSCTTMGMDWKMSFSGVSVRADAGCSTLYHVRLCTSVKREVGNLFIDTMTIPSSPAATITTSPILEQ